jgi:sugar lactone lactonase YvrE
VVAEQKKRSGERACRFSCQVFPPQIPKRSNSLGGMKTKTKHQHPAVSLSNPLHTVLFAVTVLVLLASAIAHADYIYVSCHNQSSGTIEKFDSSGNRSTFASDLNRPQGLAFNSSGNLYAADSGYGTIEKFDSSGNISTFASGLDTPLGLAFDSSSNLYVACFPSGVGTIEKFDSSGNRSTFASGLGGPQGLAFDSSGNLYVATSSTIEKFDSSGNGSIFASGLGSPQGLAFDSSGNLYVASFYDSTIEKFDSSGNGSLFASGLSRPLGLAFDSSDNLYVANFRGMIYKFDSSGNRSTFASGLNYYPNFIATQVPEPASAMLMAIGGAILSFRRKHLKRAE